MAATAQRESPKSKHRLVGKVYKFLKYSQFSDVDDWEGPSGVKLMGRLKQIHGMGKTSGWEDLGPPVNKEPRGVDPMSHIRFKRASIKTAEPPPPKGVSPELWDKILAGKARSEKIKEKVAFKLQGHTDVQGIPIAIENCKGSVRKGTGKDGKEWRTKMLHPYGYIKGTKGADGEEVDCYVGPDKEAPAAFVVHQHKEDGTGYDEDKTLLGFSRKTDAVRAFLKHYDSPKFLGPISKIPIAELKELIAERKGKKLVKIRSGMLK